MVPIIATLLSNALPLIANAVLAKGKDFVKEKTGVDLDVAQLSPEQLTTLKKYEMEHEEELMRLRLEENKLDAALQQMYLQDTADARKRESSIADSANATTLQKNTAAYLALGTVIATFVLFGVFCFSPVALDNGRKEIVIYILGVLSTIASQIFSYYFGSSAGSAAKGSTIDNLVSSAKLGSK